MTTITPEQRQAIAAAGEAPVELADPLNGEAYVLLPVAIFQRMKDQLEKEADEREHDAWANLARRARNQWAQENPY